MKIKGIDVSKWQGNNIDWKKVASDGIKFVFIRVGNRGLSTGKISKDVCFDRNIKGALENGLDVGIYFYSSSITEAEAIEEANFTIQNIKGYNITMPVVFDYEGFSTPTNRNYGMTKAKITANCIAFQNVIKAHGYTCLLYGSKSYLPNKFDLKRLTDLLWVARYPSGTKVLDDDKYKPTIKGYDDRIAIWQCASCGKVDGIKGNVDINYMYIDVSAKKTVEQEKPEQAVAINTNQNIMAYSKAKDGKTKLSPNFEANEFACKDGSDPIFISPSLVEILQAVRDYFGRPVVVNSGYRTPAYNKKIGGATYSQHLYGTGADIRITGVAPNAIAQYIETLMPNTGGIGIYGNFVHVDVRKDKARWNG